MSNSPAAPVHAHTLFDGRRVLVRPVRGDDERLERDFIGHLSPESRYLRFHKWVAAPSSRLIDFLTHVDGERHVALVGVAPDRGRETIVGEARYVTLPGGRRCDFGIVIADEWRKSGLAGVLMAELIAAARERGIQAMESQVLAANRDMLRFARGLGFHVEREAGAADTVRIEKRL